MTNQAANEYDQHWKEGDRNSNEREFGEPAARNEARHDRCHPGKVESPEMVVGEIPSSPWHQTTGDR